MIRLEGVTRRYRSAAGERVALDAVDLTVARGQVFGVVGRSGAGKSTLIRTINRLERPDAGRVFVGEQEITALGPKALRSARRRIGMIFQHFNLLNARTIEENVAFPLRLEGRPDAEVRARTAELLARLGLAEHARKHPAQLSGGQKQRVGIARALACGPEVLLCDEATSALDPESEAIIQRNLADIARGRTMIIVSHRLSSLVYSDAILVLDNGQVADFASHAVLLQRCDVYRHLWQQQTQHLQAA